MHFGRMDRYGTWVVRMYPAYVGATFAILDSAEVDISDIGPLPDTVRPDGILELDVLVDVNGLLTWRPAGSEYVLHSDHIHVTQR